MDFNYYIIKSCKPFWSCVIIFQILWSFFVTFFELNVTRCYLKLRLFLFFVTRVSLSISEATGVPSTTLFKQKKRILAKRERGAQIHPKTLRGVTTPSRSTEDGAIYPLLPTVYPSFMTRWMTKSRVHTLKAWRNIKHVSILVPFCRFRRSSLLPIDLGMTSKRPRNLYCVLY